MNLVPSVALLYQEDTLVEILVLCIIYLFNYLYMSSCNKQIAYGCLLRRVALISHAQANQATPSKQTLSGESEMPECRPARLA